MNREAKATILAVALPLTAIGIAYLSRVFPSALCIAERVACGVMLLMLSTAVFVCWWGFCYALFEG